MMHDPTGHPDDERLSALAAGDEDATKDAALGDHVTSCGRCSAVVDASARPANRPGAAAGSRAASSASPAARRTGARGPGGRPGRLGATARCSSPRRRAGADRGWRDWGAGDRGDLRAGRRVERGLPSPGGSTAAPAPAEAPAATARGETGGSTDNSSDASKPAEPFRRVARRAVAGYHAGRSPRCSSGRPSSASACSHEPAEALDPAERDRAEQQDEQDGGGEDGGPPRVTERARLGRAGGGASRRWRLHLARLTGRARSRAGLSVGSCVNLPSCAWCWPRVQE